MEGDGGANSWRDLRLELMILLSYKCDVLLPKKQAPNTTHLLLGIKCPMIWMGF